MDKDVAEHTLGVSHSALPWDCVIDGNVGSIGAQEDGRRIHIASISGSMTNPEIAADARFIVRAVNGHDDLVAALTEARRWVEANTAQVRGISDAAAAPGEAMLRSIDLALSKAEGRTPEGAKS